MPTYSYACTACEHRFDSVQAFSDSSLTDCPECTGRLRKLFSSIGIVFKGSGFYRNDSRSDPVDGSGEGKNGSKSDSTTSDPATSDPATSGSAKSGSGSAKSGSGSAKSNSKAGPAKSGSASGTSSSDSSSTSRTPTAAVS